MHAPTLLATLLLVAPLVAAPAVFWGWELLGPARKYTPSSIEWFHDDISVRIITRGQTDVVNATLTALDPRFTSVVVISETPLPDVDAPVAVVPPEFSSHATRKGRALEWARLTLSCDHEYILYLDEDTLLPRCEGLPDADIVQLRERPYRTGSRLAYFTEIFRMGYQTEQRAFPHLKLPLYAWGGGLAVRTRIEQDITWDRPTFIEDTVFTWHAVLDGGASFDLAWTRCFNQAPKTIMQLLRQRRRWMAGTQAEDGFLPERFFALSRLRGLGWAISPIIPLLLPLVYYTRTIGPSLTVTVPIAAISILWVFSWSALGVQYYELSRWHVALILLTTPLLTVINGAGAAWGFLSAPKDFDVTPKVAPKQVRRAVRDGETAVAVVMGTGESNELIVADDNVRIVVDEV